MPRNFDEEISGSRGSAGRTPTMHNFPAGIRNLQHPCPLVTNGRRQRLYEHPLVDPQFKHL